jgi:hypothetical protein
LACFRSMRRPTQTGSSVHRRRQRLALDCAIGCSYASTTQVWVRARGVCDLMLLLLCTRKENDVVNSFQKALAYRVFSCSFSPSSICVVRR